VNAFDPGLVDTRMHEEIRNLPVALVGPDMHARLVQYKKEGLLRPPDVIAGAIALLLTRDDVQVSGEVLNLAECKRRVGLEESSGSEVPHLCVTPSID